MQCTPFVQRPTIWDVLDPTAIWDEAFLSYHVLKFVCIKLGKAPLLGDVDLLATRKLELGPTQSLNHMFLVLQFGADGHDDLSNVDSGYSALGLSKGSPHTCLEPVSPSTGQHFVDTDDMEGMESHSDMKPVLATAFHHVLVGTDPGSLQSFRRELFILIRHHVATEWEFVHFGLLPSQVKDADFSIWDTTTETRLRVWLILTVPITVRKKYNNLEAWK